MTKRFGDRRDAIKVRNVDGLHKIMVCLKSLRCDSDVYINEKVDVTELVKYVKEKKKSDPEFTFFHAFCGAISKMFYERPLLNRFVLNRKFYDHREISIGFVAKVAFEDDSKENVNVVTISPDDDINKIKERFSSKVQTVRSNTNNSSDYVVNLFGKMPQWLVNIAVWFLRKLDNYDLLPRSITDDSIYHSSVIVTNLGSIKCGAIYHNLTDFGTSSSLIAIGQIKKEMVVTAEGKTEIRDMVDIGVTCDERIADGFYFAKSILLFKHIIENPEILEKPIKEKMDYESKL